MRELTMERLWRGPFFMLPFLYLGTWRNIMFPEQGEEIPFRLENWAYRDSFGREIMLAMGQPASPMPPRHTRTQVSSDGSKWPSAPAMPSPRCMYSSRVRCRCMRIGSRARPANGPKRSSNSG